jgi:hypothetical protein
MLFVDDTASARTRVSSVAGVVKHDAVRRTHAQRIVEVCRGAGASASSRSSGGIELAAAGLAGPVRLCRVRLVNGSSRFAADLKLH